jgi:hypothetical protein
VRFIRLHSVSARALTHFVGDVGWGEFSGRWEDSLCILVALLTERRISLVRSAARTLIMER